MEQNDHFENIFNEEFLMKIYYNIMKLHKDEKAD